MFKEIKIVSDYATEAHASVNHTYVNNQPYSFHLEMVYSYGLKYSYLLPKDKVINALSACWTHDLIEDCRITYNDLANIFNISVADITYNLTNNKGKSRSERAGDSYYEAIFECQVSTFVKICDRLANGQYSKDSGSGMFKKYKKEHANFRQRLYTPEFQEMWDELDEIFEIERCDHELGDSFIGKMGFESRKCLFCDYVKNYRR